MQPPGGNRSYEQLTIEMLDRLRASGVVTDVNPGSVVRTLVEAFARELARTYEQLSLMYEMGFIDTATGEALNHLVELLGQKRYTGQEAVGEATFRRDTRVAGQVTIPAGTSLQVAGASGTGTVYLTRRNATLAVGQTDATTEIYAPLDPTAPPETVQIKPGDMPVTVTLQSALAGVGSVSIDRPTSVRGQTESDSDLRARVKGLILAAGGGTAKALEQAVISSGLAEAVTFRDAQDAPPDGAQPLQAGELEVVAQTTSADLRPELRRALLAAKAPGILLRLRDIALWPISLNVTVKLAGAPGPEERDRIRSKAEQIVSQALEGLQPGDKLRWSPVMAALLQMDGVADIPAAAVLELNTDKQVNLVSTAAGGVLVLPEYGPASFSRYQRLVPPEDGQPVTIALEGERTVYVGVRFDSLPKTLPGQLHMDAAQLIGAVADELARHLDELNQKMASTKTGPAASRPKVDYNALREAIYRLFGSYKPDAKLFHVTYWDTAGGGSVVLSSANPADEKTVAFDPSQVLRPAPGGIVVTQWSNAG